MCNYVAFVNYCRQPLPLLPPSVHASSRTVPTSTSYLAQCRNHIQTRHTLFHVASTLFFPVPTQPTKPYPYLSIHLQHTRPFYRAVL